MKTETSCHNLLHLHLAMVRAFSFLDLEHKTFLSNVSYSARCKIVNGIQNKIEHLDKDGTTVQRKMLICFNDR